MSIDRILLIVVVLAVGGLALQNHALSQHVAGLTFERPAPPPPPPLDPRFIACFTNRPTAPPLAEPVRAAEPTPAEPPPPSPGFETADSTLASAIGRGHLTDADLSSLREQLAGASAEEADEIRRKIAVALNRDQLIPDDPRNIFP